MVDFYYKENKSIAIISWHI